MESSKSTQNCEKESAYKIYISSSPIVTNPEHLELFNIDTKSTQCIRCGRHMKGFQSVFVTIRPPLVQPNDKSTVSGRSSFNRQSTDNPFRNGRRNITKTDVNSSSDGYQFSTISFSTDSTGSFPSRKNSYPFSFIPDINGTRIKDQDHIENCANCVFNDSYESSTENCNLPSNICQCSSEKLCFKFHGPKISNFDSSDEIYTGSSNGDSLIARDFLCSHSEDSLNYNLSDLRGSPRPMPRPEHTTKAEKRRNFEIRTDISLTPCKDCHVAVVDTKGASTDDQQTVSLMLQISNVSDIMEAYLKEYESPRPSSVEIGNGVNPETMVDIRVDAGVNLSGSLGSDPNLFDLDSAYQSHLRSLVPCTFCGRTFHPHRVAVHERACLERPDKRKKRRRGWWK